MLRPEWDLPFVIEWSHMPSGSDAHKPSGGSVPTTAFTSLQPWLKISSLGFQRSALFLNLGGTFLLSNTLPGENKEVVLFGPWSSGYAASSTMGAHRKPLNVQLVRIRLVSCKWRKWRLWSWKWSDEIQSSYLTKAAFQTLPFALALLSWNLELPRNTVLMTVIWLSQH